MTSGLSPIPQPDSKDRTYNLITGTLSFFTLDASGLFSMIMKPPIEKRLNDWLQELAQKLIELQSRVEDFNIESLEHNEKFISTMLQLTQIAVSTHELDKLKVLRDAALNSALPKSPDEIRQKIFVQWLGELTPWHWKILPLFEDPSLRSIPLDLDDDSWKINMYLTNVGEFIEIVYPEMKGEEGLYIQIIKDLHQRGLIANKFPAIGMMTRIEHSPRLTSLAKQFLEFIKSPLGD